MEGRLFYSGSLTLSATAMKQLSNLPQANWAFQYIQGAGVFQGWVFVCRSLGLLTKTVRA